MAGKGGNTAGRGSLHRRASLAAWHSSHFCSQVSCFLPHLISLNLQRCFLSLHKNSPICFLRGSPGLLSSADTPEEQFPDLTNQLFFPSSLSPCTFSSRKKAQALLQPPSLHIPTPCPSWIASGVQLQTLLPGSSEIQRKVKHSGNNFVL